MRLCGIKEKKEEVICIECQNYKRADIGLACASNRDYKKMCERKVRVNICDYDPILGKNFKLEFFDPRIENKNFNCPNFLRKEDA